MLHAVAAAGISQERNKDHTKKHSPFLPWQVAVQWASPQLCRNWDTKWSWATSIHHSVIQPVTANASYPASCELRPRELGCRVCTVTIPASRCQLLHCWSQATALKFHLHTSGTCRSRFIVETHRETEQRVGSSTETIALSDLSCCFF